MHLRFMHFIVYKYNFKSFQKLIKKFTKSLIVVKFLEWHFTFYLKASKENKNKTPTQ